MSYPGSNVTFNLYDVNPPSYPIGLGKPSGAAGSGEDNVLRPRSPLSTANSLVLPPSSKSPSSGTTPLASDSTPTSSGAGLKKSQSLRVPNRTVAPLAIPTSSRDDTVRPASSAHPGSLNRSQTALSPLSASVSSNSGSQSAGGLLGSSNPFNDLSSSLQIPSFRPNLSRMGRKISEFGKEVFSLEEEPELPSRVRTPVGGGAAAAALGGERRAVSGAGSGVGGEGTKAPVPRPGAMAPPLIRSGTAPVPLAPSSGTILAAGTTSTNPPTLNRSSTSMVTSTSQPSRPVTRPASIPEDVPGMGDEPIMCPFCDKPLPPPLIISQLAHLHAVKERGKRASEATLVDKVDKGAEGAVKRADSVPAKPADIAPAPAAAAAKTKGDERATAESFLPVVKMSEAAEKAASAPEGLISADQIKEWSRRAGIKVDDSESTSKTTGSARLVAPDEVKTATAAQATPAPAPASEAFSLLPPPPPPASRVKSPAPANSAIAKSDLEDSSRSKVPDGGHGSRFGGLFGKKGAQSDGQDEEDDSGDDYAQGGYAKLSGPASPERVENRRLELGERKKSPVGSEKGDSAVTGGERGLGDGIGDKVESTGDAAVVKDEKAEGAPVGSDVQGNKTASGGDQDDLKAVLQEVLDKVNMMTKSHTELATSHNHLLTSLKIARSNLVMAEANAEMLEEQLRKAAIHQPAATHGSAIPPRKSSAAIQDGRRSLEETRRPAGPVQAVKAAPKPRPNSLVIPASALFETGPMTGPASSRPSMEAASKAGNNSHSSSGVFGGFFGGKTLSSLNIPTAKELQASAARLGDSLAGPSRPGTPINGGLMVAGPGGASGLGYAHAQSNAHLRADHSTSQPSSSTSPAQFFDYHMPSPPTSHHPSPNPDGTGRVVSGSGSGPGSGHGASPSNNSTPLARPALSPAHSGQFATEFAKLRNAYASSQTKMEAMARELTDLKKGKIEMEAELETLSQALFEEANKMVADERRKRLESEEMLKEVKEEKEVLKETIKVLGGKDKVPEVTVTAESADEVKEAKTAGKVEDDLDDEAWKPRDLDKHYEALRKTIHHVADGASPNTAVLGDGGAMLTDAVNYSGATREFEAALDEVQAAAEAEGVLGFTPVGVNPVLELSPVLPKETREAEVNPWAEVDFSGASASTAVPRKTSHGYGMDPLESRRESLGLNLRGVDFGEGLDGSAVIEPPTRRAAAEETPVQETGSIGMRRTSSA